MKKLLYPLVICTVLMTAQAQDYEKRPWMPLENRIGLALGIGTVTYLDKNTSPLIYRSKPANVRLFYNLESNTFLFSLDIDFRIGSNQPKYHPNRTLYFREEDYTGKTEDKKFPAGGSFMAGRISLGTYYKIPSTQESTFKVAVGGRISNELFYPQGWTVAGMFNALSFSPEGLVQHRVNEHHSITASARIPVAAWLTRPPYDNTASAPDKTMVGGFFSNARWVSVDQFLAPAIGLRYDYQFNQRWGAGINYEAGWHSITSPQPFRSLNQTLLANVYHNF
ncbi:MAG: hypothetical protein MUE95_08635 [Cyclobacteriaceae bacterium]|jgi:hypothetical protein|nr:hypothetical protein [Cyclobacteriaceae bacterium]